MIGRVQDVMSAVIVVGATETAGSAGAAEKRTYSKYEEAIRNYKKSTLKLYNKTEEMVFLGDAQSSECDAK